MTTTHVLPDILRTLNENQLAIAAAVEELSKWVAERGSDNVAGHVRDCLAHLDKNADFLATAIGSLYLA
jgi:hypothetical protein